ncbi:odorant receptor 67c-like [Onthophagus taurus]|uniref:odorant receptor 67c-like n=1 Tax=Onthophagus taurus TaxID=166361 RepID=UPI0039BE9802
MSTTLGFYVIKKNLQKYYCWPSNQWYIGIGSIILVALNTIWVFYPLVTELMNFQTNFSKCLFHMQFIMAVTLVLSGSVQALRYRNQTFEMIKLLSDFNQLDIPRELETIERKLKYVLKIIHWSTYLFAYLVTYFTLLDDNCATFKTIKHCLILVYYVPFELKPLNMTLLLLFQIYTIGILMNIIFVTTVMYCYSLQLLIIRIEHLNEKIDGITLTRNKERNFRMLRPIIMYHQDIFRMFQFSNDVYTNLIVPQKLFALCILTLSTTSFFMGKDIASLTTAIASWFGLFLSHTMGQKLTTVGDSVANAVYNLNWCDADVVTRKQVLTLLYLSQHPFTIRVPLFGEMSHAAAAQELKKVYLFINSLLAIKKNNNF